ncbi:Hypothetical protein R9X50_00295100 [Acrodontium crateriforme]|uniref:DNA replication complex GINS protein PSF3 n=1 Tax=Acrodontium crateriforme TaxID=150365 RepID=A0AAQ3M4V6_9PEZI|nr:Hypothetical protein R9X50_00295100 [Acrodontium crateriforme]
MAYFSPTSILTDAQKVPCTFELAVPHLKPLNSGSSIDQGTKLDLPLWMGEMLALDTHTDPLATMEMPTALGQRVMNALRADAKSVDLRAQAQWFYGLGERMLFLFEDDEMVDVLTNTFKKRAHEIADKAQNTRGVQQGGDSNDFVMGLDETERLLFRSSHESTQAVKKWFETSSRA